MAHRVGTLSRRQKPLQNRTPLIVYKHEVEDALEYIVETVDNADGHKTLTALGVEKGEADEHHLLAALGHAGATYGATPRRTDRKRSRSPTSFAQAAAKPATQPLPAYNIPTPDASRQAKEADSFYSFQPKWIRPEQLIRSSETVEQLSNGWGGLNYVMDERDEAWLSEFNSKQEGTSSVKQEPYANGAPNGKEGGKSKKGKEKDRKDDKEGTGALKISEDVFEYVMGMLELWTEKNVPMLHTDLAQLPTFDAVEAVFRDTPPASFYPAYEVPQCLPSPPLLTRIARNIFPYWQQRKEQREGKSIIPQLNLSWSEENDPYICFRRRDKPVTRKTRNRDMTSSDRMTRIQNELTQAMALVRMVSEREKQKKKSYLAEKDIWQARYHVLDVKRKSGALNCTPEEEALLFPTRNNSNNALLAAATAIANGSKRQRLNNAAEKDDITRSAAGLGSGFPSSSGLATGGSTLKSGLTNGALSSRSRAASPIMERVPPEQLAGLLAEKVERELKRKREADRNIEDSTNLAYQPLPIASAFRHFRCLPSTESLAVSQSSVPSKPWDPESTEAHPMGEEDASTTRPNHQPCFRLRRGRGGIIRLDRRMPSVAHSQAMERSRYGDSFLSRMFMVNPLARRRHRDPSEEQVARPDGVSVEEEDEEAARILSERWRYDAVQGAVGVGMGVTDDDQIVVDDYEIKYIQNRMKLVTGDDLADLLPSNIALDRVHAALAQPPPSPQEVVFSRSVPVPPPPQTNVMAQQGHQQIPMPADPAMIRQVRQLGDQAAAAQARALYMQQQAHQQRQMPHLNAAGQQQSPTTQAMVAMGNQVPQLAQMVNGVQQNGMPGNQTPRMNNMPPGGMPSQLVTRPIVAGQMPQIRRMASNGQPGQLAGPTNSASPVNGLPAGMPSLPNGMNGAPNGMVNGVNGLPNGMNNTPLNLVNMAAAARQGQISPQVLQALLHNGNRMPNGTKFPSPMDNNGNGWLKMSS